MRKASNWWAMGQTRRSERHSGRAIKDCTSPGGVLDWSVIRFLYLQCHLNEIALLDRDSARLADAKSLPSNLLKIFEQALNRLGNDLNDKKVLTDRVLAWLLYCEYPLNLHFLAAQASITPFRPYNRRQRVDQDDSIFGSSRSLIHIQNTGIVVLYQLGVKEFLQSEFMPDRDVGAAGNVADCDVSFDICPFGR